MYQIDLANRQGVTLVHLFGILYGEDLREAEITPLAVVRRAQIPKGYSSELSTGIALSQYVTVRDETYQQLPGG